MLKINSSVSSLKTTNVSFKVLNPNDKENHYQPVILTLNFINGFALEFSIITKDNLNHLTIELLNENKEIICKDSFKYKIEEFKWYSFIITKPSDQKYVKK